MASSCTVSRGHICATRARAHAPPSCECTHTGASRVAASSAASAAAVGVFTCRSVAVLLSSSVAIHSSSARDGARAAAVGASAMDGGAGAADGGACAADDSPGVKVRTARARSRVSRLTVTTAVTVFVNAACPYSRSERRFFDRYARVVPQVRAYKAGSLLRASSPLLSLASSSPPPPGCALRPRSLGTSIIFLHGLK